MSEAMTADNATHLLHCTHAFSSKAAEHYTMPCHVLKTMRDGRYKVLVFGERNWKGTSGKSRVRYVQANRVTPKVAGE